MTESSARMLVEIQAATQFNPDWLGLDLTRASNVHIAIMSEPFLSYVFEGRKTIESRFSLNKIAPYDKVKLGDIVSMEAGPIVGCFTISWAKSFDLQKYPITEIAKEYGTQICGDEVFWSRRSNKRYATLMGD